ncbi:MAG: DUF2207 domain-containing protein [Anaerolineae bacterium]|nr:DUF2207 domain-containing protein [Anaerolineae bacterium]
MLRKLLFGLLCCALFFTIAAQRGKAYRADRFDVEVAIQPDGSLNIEEKVTFRFTGGPFSFVFRELPTDHTDGIVNITAGADGMVWPQGTGPGQVEISGRNPIRIEWHLPPTSDTTQTFTLAYTQLGVVERGSTADILNWQALPDEYEYEIDGSRLTIHFPPAGKLTAEPKITVGNALVTTEPGRAIFDMQNLSPNDPLVVRLSFAPGAFVGEAPAWQTQRETQNSRAWIWIASAAAILLGGFLALFGAARNNIHAIPKANSYVQKPPVDLPPALAGYLATQSVGWQHALATIFDLAGRGFIEIEQVREKSLWRSAEFTMTLLKYPEDLRLYEDALLDLLFTDKHGAPREVITLSEMGRLITSSRWKAYSHALEEEAKLEGLVDPTVKGKRNKMIGVGIALTLLSPLIIIGMGLFFSATGLWPLLLFGAISLLGVVAIILGSAYTRLSDKGMQYATAFDPFRRFLKDVTKKKTGMPDPTYFEIYLPYATAYGLAQQWAKRMAESDDPRIPAYFRAAETGEPMDMGAFIAVIVATSSHGGAAGAGSAGAGAAGGGASGAG